jgi:hypothetical protein
MLKMPSPWTVAPPPQQTYVPTALSPGQVTNESFVDYTIQTGAKSLPTGAKFDEASREFGEVKRVMANQANASERSMANMSPQSTTAPYLRGKFPQSGVSRAYPDKPYDMGPESEGEAGGAVMLATSITSVPPSKSRENRRANVERELVRR